MRGGMGKVGPILFATLVRVRECVVRRGFRVSQHRLQTQASIDDLAAICEMLTDPSPNTVPALGKSETRKRKRIGVAKLEIRKAKANALPEVI